MQKLGFSLLFFMLCFATVSSAQEKSNKDHQTLPNIDSLLMSLHIDSIMYHMNVDSILYSVNIDSIVRELQVDSIMRRVNVDSILRKANFDSVLRLVNIDSLFRRLNLDSLWKANRSKIERYLKADGSAPNQSNKNYTISGSVTIGNNSYGSKLYIDTLWGNRKLTPKELKQFRIMQNSPNYYFAQNGERYYMNIVPPAQKGERVDSSDVWLLRSR